MKPILVMLTLIALIFSGCAPTSGPKESVGTLLGAGSGAILGAQIGHGQGRLVAVAIGTLAGAIMGQEIGRSLDTADHLAMERNAQYALENTRTNYSTTWRNPDSGNYGSITPVETYQTNDRKYCREYLQKVVIAGQQQQAYGTACRQPDGSWLIVK